MEELGSLEPLTFLGVALCSPQLSDAKGCKHLLTQKEGPLGTISTEGCCGSRSDSHVTVSERSDSEALIQFTAANIKGLPGEAGLQPALVSALRSQTSTVC